MRDRFGVLVGLSESCWMGGDVVVVFECGVVAGCA
jgi:hypothetical protein